VDQWDRGPRTLIKALLIAVALLAVAYWMALPLVVRTVTAQVPQSALEAIGTQVLASLDNGLLGPSALTPDRQTELSALWRPRRRPRC
jgi:hypothetical protein